MIRLQIIDDVAGQALEIMKDDDMPFPVLRVGPSGDISEGHEFELTSPECAAVGKVLLLLAGETL